MTERSDAGTGKELSSELVFLISSFLFYEPRHKWWLIATEHFGQMALSSPQVCLEESEG